MHLAGFVVRIRIRRLIALECPFSELMFVVICVIRVLKYFFLI